MPARSVLLLPAIVVTLATLLAPPAHAASRYGGHSSFSDSAEVWLISGNALASVDLQSGNGSSLTTIGVSAGVGHSLGPSFEVQVLGTYYSMSGSNQPTTSVFEIDGQINWVILGNHAEALYLGARVGYDTNTNSGNSSSYLSYGAVLGKRFQLTGPVSYDPNVSVVFTNNSSGSGSPDFHIVPLQFTLVF